MTTPETNKPPKDAADGGSVDGLLELRIRSLIEDKAMVTAQANLDLARGREWRCDYAAWHGQIDAEIQNLLSGSDKLLAHSQDN